MNNYLQFILTQIKTVLYTTKQYNIHDKTLSFKFETIIFRIKYVSR